MCPVHLISQHVPKILATVEWLLTCQDDSGNWPTQAPDGLSGRVSDLVQWCHGAPGILILLSTVLRSSRKKYNRMPLDKHLEHKIITSLQHGATLVYRHGFLRKGVGICHGVAGSIYALLAVSDAIDTSNTSALGHAVRLAHIATKYESYISEGEMTVPDHPWSLYEGLAGMCCAWAEVLHRLESKRARKCSGMPGIDDLG
ncbi:hypothetical protein BDQ12DRAFT_689289 [Crucibulum laeve]|uniref:Terpenoid cyclases/protein prenyltransferase alpha-alpha toroid n=1 Tax=Crucibulum laeve TaxID=68775 RepID=A0A5C3LQN2_9AGAR|nr:hypothetical protein BDQ12DRAFT_689289 [Crucibulum laeve]